MVSNYELIKVGEQTTPIVVIDGFIPDPLSLVETIAQHHPFTKQDGDFIRVRSHPPQEYVEHLHTRFRCCLANLLRIMGYKILVWKSRFK